MGQKKVSAAGPYDGAGGRTPRGRPHGTARRRGRTSRRQERTLRPLRERGQLDDAGEDERGPEATEETTPRQRGRTPGAELGTAMPASTTSGAAAAAPTALGTAAPAQTTPGTAPPEGPGKGT